MFGRTSKEKYEKKTLKDLRFQTVSPFADLNSVESIWKYMLKRCDHSFFLSWGWVENWICSLPENSKEVLLVAKEKNMPVLAFFVGGPIDQVRKYMPVKTISLNTTGIAEYDRLVIECNAFLSRSSSGCALKQILDSMPIEWEEFLLPWLDMSLCPGNCLQDGLRPYHVLTRKKSLSHYVDLQKVRECNGDYLSLLGKKTRRHMRQTERRYSENGTTKFQVASTVDDGLKIYDEMAALNRLTWQKRGKDSAFNSEYFYKFHRNFITKRFTTGEIQLVKLTCGEETIGCLYNFVYEGKVYLYQSGYNYKDDKRLRPGYLTNAKAIIYNSTIGNLTYDFLAGDAKYKRSLSTDYNKLVWAAIQKPYFKFWKERLQNRAERLQKKLKVRLKNKIKKFIR